MANLLVDMRDLEFLLYEQLELLNLTETELFGFYSKDEFDMIMEQGLKFALNELAPANEDGDRIGARWEDGKVTLPESFYKPLKIFGEQGWVSACEDPDLGGQGLPITVFTACNEMFHAANTALNLYPSLAHGCVTMIREHGTEDQKKKYLEKLMTYEWAGTMNLTEPGAGSDLARISTKAIPTDDGRYLISGQKIFITGGEHDGHPNIIHPVLARIEGDPPGIKGISIFLVPKYLVNEDGSMGEWNDVTCAGIEHKMGIRGSATCQMSFGDNGKCAGEILGKPGQGLPIMFLIMNEERLNVGLQSVGLGSTAYLNALNYAREREQGVDIRLKGKSTDIVSIIKHPDVRRTLLGMKAWVEGLRALNYYAAYQLDLFRAEIDPEKKKLHDGMVELLTPVCKGYTSIRGLEVCSDAVNIFGGYGYCQDYPVEQFMRDQKITALYEGTNTIHSVDLFNRKMKMEDGRYAEELYSRIQSTIDEVKRKKGMEQPVSVLQRTLDLTREAGRKMYSRMEDGKVPEAFQDTVVFLEVVGDLILGWMHIWQLSLAEARLGEILAEKQAVDTESVKAVIEDSPDAAFYSGKVHSARYYLEKLLPMTEGRIAVIESGNTSALDVEEAALLRAVE